MRRRAAARGHCRRSTPLLRLSTTPLAWVSLDAIDARTSVDLLLGLEPVVAVLQPPASGDVHVCVACREVDKQLDVDQRFQCP